MLLPNLPPPRLEGAGGHMVEDQSREGAPCLGTSQWHLVVTICLHGGTQLNPPSWLWCGEYSPSLTEIEFFGDQTLFASPPQDLCLPLAPSITECVTLETKKREQLEMLSFSTEIK